MIKWFVFFALLFLIFLLCYGHLAGARATGFEGTYRHVLTTLEKQERNRLALKHGLYGRVSVEYEDEDGTFYFYRNRQKIKF